MNHNGRPLIVKLLLGFYIFSMFTIFSFAYVIANRGDEAFENPKYDGRSITIQSCIIDGAGYYLQAYSDILLFLQEIEWSNPENVNYDELKRLLNRSLDGMKNAGNTYANLEKLANTTPYNPVFIEKLTAFDYRAFQQSRAAYSIAFIATRIYLAAGDVRGLFMHIKAGTGQILGMLMDIKAAVDMEKFPELSVLWRLNQKTAEIMLTGQFAAEIFDKISRKQ
jgi:hypothetical protein